jgi:alcohol dehydrogenase, propanol-preferring
LKVVGIDARDEGLELSRELGADLMCDARQGKEKVLAEVKKFTGEGVDATINVSDAKSAAALACAITKMHAKMIQIAQVRRSIAAIEGFADGMNTKCSQRKFQYHSLS